MVQERGYERMSAFNPCVRARERPQGGQNDSRDRNDRSTDCRLAIGLRNTDVLVQWKSRSQPTNMSAERGMAFGWRCQF